MKPNQEWGPTESREGDFQPQKIGVFSSILRYFPIFSFAWNSIKCNDNTSWIGTKKERREGGFNPTGFFFRNCFQVCFQVLLYFHVLFTRTKHVFLFLISVHLAIEFETSGRRVVSSRKVFSLFQFFVFSIAFKCIEKQCMFVLFLETVYILAVEFETS